MVVPKTEKMGDPFEKTVVVEKETEIIIISKVKEEISWNNFVVKALRTVHGGKEETDEVQKESPTVQKHCQRRDEPQK